MSVYKFLGGFLVIGCGLLIGVAGALTERRRVRAAKGYLHLLSFIREQLHTFTCPMSEAFLRAPRIILDECGADGRSFRTFTALLNATKSQLSRPVAALLHELAEKKGSSDRETQLRCLDDDIARLQHLCVGLSADLTRREQIAFCMPLALFAMLVVLLL